MRGARLIAGTDLGERIRIESVEGTARRMMQAAFHYMYLLRRKTPGLCEPLGYPDPDGEYLGYEQWGQLEPDRSWNPGTGQLVATATAIATARLAMEAGVQAQSKAHSVRLARDHLGSEFAA